MTAVRALPIPLHPLPGETVTGYVGRLATANAMDFRDLKLHVRELGGLSVTKPNLERVPEIVEALGGLPVGYFAADARSHGMCVRCSHYEWRPLRCKTCSRPQAPRSECRRCAAGASTTTRRRGGAVCLHHRRWHLDGRDINLAAHAEYGRAERWLSGKLWLRGIALHTGELQLAVHLILAAVQDDVDGSSAPTQRAKEFGVALDASYEDALLCTYPEAVALVGILIDPEFLRCLLTPRFTARAQVEIMQAAVAGVLRNTGGRSLHETATMVIERSREAMMVAYGSLKSYGVKTIRCDFDKALIASARSTRACLLRHLDTVRVPSGWGTKLWWPAPPTDVLNRANLRPDPRLGAPPRARRSRLAVPGAERT